MDNLQLMNRQPLHHDEKYRCLCTARNPYLDYLEDIGISSKTHFIITEIGIFADDSEGIPFEYSNDGVKGDTPMNILAHLLLNIAAFNDVKEAANKLGCKSFIQQCKYTSWEIPYIDTIKEFGNHAIRQFFHDININVDGNTYVPSLDILDDIYNSVTISEPTINTRPKIGYTILQNKSPALLVNEII